MTKPWAPLSQKYANKTNPRVPTSKNYCCKNTSFQPKIIGGTGGEYLKEDGGGVRSALLMKKTGDLGRIWVKGGEKQRSWRRRREEEDALRLGLVGLDPIRLGPGYWYPGVNAKVRGV